uniref:Uncharacterized protein n=1 Tax=Triticum urartu TaxID=4572 RepID=A0A8R7QR46_TRIUA
MYFYFGCHLCTWMLPVKRVTHVFKKLVRDAKCVERFYVLSWFKWICVTILWC